MPPGAAAIIVPRLGHDTHPVGRCAQSATKFDRAGFHYLCLSRRQINTLGLPSVFWLTNCFHLSVEMNLGTGLGEEDEVQYGIRECFALVRTTDVQGRRCGIVTGRSGDRTFTLIVGIRGCSDHDVCPAHRGCHAVDRRVLNHDFAGLNHAARRSRLVSSAVRVTPHHADLDTISPRISPLSPR